MGLFDFWKRKQGESPATPLAFPSASSPDQEWDEVAREDLRDQMRNAILGEVRLNRFEPAAILDTCREVYIEDRAPENEQEELLRFAAGRIEETTALHAQEQRLWPQETDCDRLDRVEEDLRKRGILLWQVSPCCDTCSGAELPDRIDVIEQRYPGFRQSVRGYAFYIDQNLPDMLAESAQVSVYLAYGWFAPEGSEVGQDVYAERALSIAHEVRESLEEHGLDVHWNGELSQKVGVSLSWQRRTRLV